MDTLTVDGQIYLSSKKAAELTGYAKDYVGQLCREGRVKARLVGRSWYVLESSIRAHRFGSEETKEAIEEEKEKPVAATWAPSVYKQEKAEFLPPLEKRQEAEPAAVTDMQAVWKEWFDTRAAKVQEAPSAPEMPLAESVPEERVGHEVVPIARIEDENEPLETEEGYEVETEDAIYEEEERKERPSRTIATSIVRSLALAAILLALGVTMVAHGFFDLLSRPTGVTASVVDFLDGTSTYKNK